MSDLWEEIDEKAVKEHWYDNEEKDPDLKENWYEEEEEKNREKKSNEISNVKKEAEMKTDLKNAHELMGLEESLRNFSVTQADNFDSLLEFILFKLESFKENPRYFELLDELFRKVCRNFSGEQVRKLSNSLKSFSKIKLNEERQTKLNEASQKAKTKPPKIQVEGRKKGDIQTFVKDLYRSRYSIEDETEDFI